MTIPALSCARRRPLALTYVLPLRRWRPEPLPEMTGYLTRIAREVEVIVVDGSPPSLFAAHRAAWGDVVVHLPIASGGAGRNGKVEGVMAGVRAATHERIVIADDDVRYELAQLRRMAELLDRADLVRPQNCYDPLPWQARWDTARTLINRAFGHDYPGTLGVRRTALLAAGGYDDDVRFENLELIRTIDAVGGRIESCRSLYVRRLPPSPSHFARQRLRQAYESFAQPARMAVELSLLPAVLALVARWRLAALAHLALAAIAVAEVGRRRDGGRAAFPFSCSLFAPAWMLERALCSWLAVGVRLRCGGLHYAGTRVRRAASASRTLRRRLAPPHASRFSELRRLR